jgi:hypothetical protein
MLDPTTPAPGRVWYCGRWRTPEQIEKRRTATARNMKSSRYRSTRAASYKRRYASDPAFRERELARNRRNYVRRPGRPGRQPLDAAIVEAREQRAKAKRHAAAERRRAALRMTERIVSEKKKALRAPAAVRSAWSRSQPNSIMRRKWPTMKDLDASARRGEWEGWTA